MNVFPEVDGVLKLMEYTFNISWQRMFDCAALVVPCHRETTILGTSPIYGDFLLIAMYRHKVVGVFFSSYLMPKSSTTWRKSMGHH